MAPTPFHLLNIPRSIYEGMIEHALAQRPLECCGLLAGVVRGDGTAVAGHRYPLVNAAASAVEFESEPASHFAADRDMRRRGLEVLAVYHSHPTSEPVPSRTDLDRNWSPDVVNLIVSLRHTPPLVRAWWLTATDYREAQWQVEEGESK